MHISMFRPYDHIAFSAFHNCTRFRVITVKRRQIRPPNGCQTKLKLLSSVRLTVGKIQPDLLRLKAMKVGYQGQRGSYCHEAAVRAFGKTSHDLQLLAFDNGMESTFSALENKTVDRAIVAVENSLDGVIHRNYDLLLRYPNLCIVGEVFVAVNHCLLGVEGASINSVRRVISHPQALAHCKERLDKLGVQAEAVESAAAAALFVAEMGLKDTGVIGSRIAAAEYGLTVIEQGLQDDYSFSTIRFFVLKLKRSRYTVPWKMTVAFSLKEGTDGLFMALAIFVANDVRVVKIESRPRRENPLRVVEIENVGSFKYFQYVFFVDLEAASTGVGKRCLDELRWIASFVRVVGTYSSQHFSF